MMSNKEKYIYVKRKKIYVPDEVYRAYKKEFNHELIKKDQTKGMAYFILETLTQVLQILQIILLMLKKSLKQKC